MSVFVGQFEFKTDQLSAMQPYWVQNSNGTNPGCRPRDRAAAARKALVSLGRSQTSQFRGVTHHCRSGRWEAHIWENRKQLYLGGYMQEIHAALAHDIAAIKFRGQPANLNFDVEHYKHHMHILQSEEVTKEQVVALLRGYRLEDVPPEGIVVQPRSKPASKTKSVPVSSAAHSAAPAPPQKARPLPRPQGHLHANMAVRAMGDSTVTLDLRDQPSDSTEPPPLQPQQQPTASKKRRVMPTEQTGAWTQTAVASVSQHTEAFVGQQQWDRKRAEPGRAGPDVHGPDTPELKLPSSPSAFKRAPQELVLNRQRIPPQQGLSPRRAATQQQQQQQQGGMAEEGGNSSKDQGQLLAAAPAAVVHVARTAVHRPRTKYELGRSHPAFQALEQLSSGELRDVVSQNSGSERLLAALQEQVKLQQQQLQRHEQHRQEQHDAEMEVEKQQQQQQQREEAQLQQQLAQDPLQQQEKSPKRVGEVDDADLKAAEALTRLHGSKAQAATQKAAAASQLPPLPLFSTLPDTDSAVAAATTQLPHRLASSSLLQQSLMCSLPLEQRHLSGLCGQTHIAYLPVPVTLSPNCNWATGAGLFAMPLLQTTAEQSLALQALTEVINRNQNSTERGPTSTAAAAPSESHISTSTAAAAAASGAGASASGSAATTAATAVAAAAAAAAQADAHFQAGLLPIQSLDMQSLDAASLQAAVLSTALEPLIQALTSAYHAAGGVQQPEAVCTNPMSKS